MFFLNQVDYPMFFLSLPKLFFFGGGRVLFGLGWWWPMRF